MLDLLGLWDAPEVARFRAKMAGLSLLRESDVRARAAAPGAMPLTNCNELWGCAFKNWGMMSGFLKLEAREWDPDWHCWDLAADPGELRDLGSASCGDLVLSAGRLYGATPQGSPPMPEKEE
jgi:hypothetical protein